MYPPIDPLYPTGVRLPYTETGDPDGVPVLLLHGLSDSRLSFDPLVPHLPDSIRAIAATQRGHGDAAKPLIGYGVEQLAGDAHSLLDELRIDRAVVVGHSLGAWVAAKLAARHPGRVRGLILTGALGPARANPVLAELFAEIQELEDPVSPAFVRDFQAATVERPLTDGLLADFVAESLKLPARVWRGLGRGFADLNLGGELERISAPTRLIWGERDTIATRSEQRLLLNAIGHAELSVYEGTGHAVHWEEPQRFAAELASFVAAPGAAPAGSSDRVAATAGQ